TTISDLYCYSLLTRQVVNGSNRNVAIVNQFISNVAPSGGPGSPYTVTLCSSSTCSGAPPFGMGQNCPADGDIPWRTDPNGAESAKGRWTLENCTGSPTTTQCDLTNSSSGALTALGTFASGVTQISSVPTSMTKASAAAAGGHYGFNNQNHLIRLT